MTRDPMTAAAMLLDDARDCIDDLATPQQVGLSDGQVTFEQADERGNNVMVRLPGDGL